MALNATPGFDLQPSAERVVTSGNYITNFDFLNQYLPDTYEKEFERYGNRSISSFLRMVGAEMPTNSDLLKWAEQGRLHIKYEFCVTTDAAASDTAEWEVKDALVPVIPGQGTTTGGDGSIAIRVGQTVMISDNSAGSSFSNKAVVTAVDYPNKKFSVAYYEGGGQTMAANGGAGSKATACSVFIYGSEFMKGTEGMENSLESDDFIFENKPIIIKDTYKVSGSDMAQIGWIEITSEDGANGYLWYLKSESDTRLRFEDYLETAMVEAVPAEQNSGAAASLTNPNRAAQANPGAGSQGLFYVVEQRGNVYDGIPGDKGEFETIVQRLDKQGAIEENVIFLNRSFSFAIDDFLAAQNSYGAGGTSYGLFDNDEEMALNLGFVGFRLGYDFYKSDWKYLNDPTMRGDLVGGKINGILVPAGSTTVYDQILGKNAKRPFLHVRYRASESEDRRYKTWITGSAGGARTSSLDAMQVNFLSERSLCTLGANNFVLFN
ncbi:MAG: putative structural protein [Prokaryotic dsDNA virus sp.]|nr:MAG: putative structural protein [Prokaryotic dsDNA virus sp.]|tara:strand:+ start:2680 stop:4155 length:1476 start_codon:yes stop_codon:yes gene_type:complete